MTEESETQKMTSHVDKQWEITAAHTLSISQLFHTLLQAIIHVTLSKQGEKLL